MKTTLLSLTLLLLALVDVGSAQSYTYGPTGRLTRIDYADGTSIDYIYDANGNRITLGANDAPPAGGGGGGGCFIATATYGSYLDPHVQSLRDFRDEYLLGNAPGRLVVSAYERLSPPIASVIARHQVLRLASRMLLSPIVLAAAFPRTALALLVLFVLWLRRRRASSRLRLST